MGHNFGSRHARRSSKSSIDAGDHLVSNKSLNQSFGPLDWRPGPVKIGQKTQNTPTLRASPRRTPYPNQTFFFNRIKKSCRIRRGFEQLSSYSGWRVITKKPRANLLARAVVKGLSWSPTAVENGNFLNFRWQNEQRSTIRQHKLNSMILMSTIEQRSSTGVHGIPQGAPKYAWGVPLSKGSQRCITNLSH